MPASQLCRSSLRGSYFAGRSLLLTLSLSRTRPSPSSSHLRRFSECLSGLRGLAIPFGDHETTSAWHLNGDANSLGSRFVTSEPPRKEPSLRSHTHTAKSGTDSRLQRRQKTDDRKHGGRRLKQVSRFLRPNTRKVPPALTDFKGFKSTYQPYRGQLTPECWKRMQEERAIYQQWGYIRHQYPKSDLGPVRRAFKRWKKMLHHVLNPQQPSSWPWREDGRWLFELDTSAAMRKAWELTLPPTRQQQWPTVMLSTMHLAPDKIGLVLDATLDPLPPGYAIHDVLLFVAKRLDLGRVKSTTERTALAEQTLCLAARVVEDSPVRHVPFAQRTFGLLANKLPAHQAGELYMILKRAGIKLHPNTLIQFARRLADDVAHKHTAFQIIKDLADGGMDLNDIRAASVITSLLHHKIGHDGLSSQRRQPFSPKDGLQHLVERGFWPNVITATALLDSLCQQGEVEEAIRLALLFSEAGVQLDAKAWATVYRGARGSLKVDNVVKALDVARAAEAPYVDVLNNALHSILFFAEMESREKRLRVPRPLPIFAPMLRNYAKKFELEPLQWWMPDALPLLLSQQPPGEPVAPLEGAQQREWEFQHSILPVVDAFFSAGEGPRLRPNSTTIAIMLRAYIKSLEQPYDLMAYYNFFKSRLEGQVQSIAGKGVLGNQGSLIHDTFILAMTDHPGLFRSALQIFGDMLKDNLKAGGPEGGETRGEGAVAAMEPIHPAPTVLTFTILLRGLMNSGERNLAKQVVQVMREHGVEPTLVTWNTLIKGHASMQDIGKTVATLQGMEAAGFKPDIYTYKAFGKLRSQTKALEMMEGIIDANRKRMDEDIM
ncbi:pentatricopeptide repeat protein [Drechmeria coniospora]|uniref:Pentatricopeptide repeat protein n=1 Tax=Drechmeria coniospora TaxID=98403 RepID=A0A151GTG5_DRECN|nr:pentatricopeptide repeat protein [Drechmeria coniospora]KYK60353.1 pentatricopeptide repeat protein [Drechmeria coniospora]